MLRSALLITSAVVWTAPATHVFALIGRHHLVRERDPLAAPRAHPLPDSFSQRS